MSLETVIAWMAIYPIAWFFFHRKDEAGRNRELLASLIYTINSFAAIPIVGDNVVSYVLVMMSLVYMIQQAIRYEVFY